MSHAACAIDQCTLTLPCHPAIAPTHPSASKQTDCERCPVVTTTRKLAARTSSGDCSCSEGYYNAPPSFLGRSECIELRRMRRLLRSELRVCCAQREEEKRVMEESRQIDKLLKKQIEASRGGFPPARPREGKRRREEGAMVK